MMLLADLMLELLVKAPAILAGGVAAIDSFKRLTAQAQTMHAEGRNPTEAERTAIKAEIDALEARVYAQDP